MNSFLVDLIANVAGNLVAWLLLGIITLYYVKRRSQARFDRFFGLIYHRRVIVYLSNLWDPKKPDKSLIKPDKSWGTPAKSGGRIMSGQEFYASQAISRLFGVSPFSIPELVRGFVDAFFIGRRIQVDVEISPMNGSYDNNINLIVVGSTLKNAVRRAHLKKNVIHLIIEGEAEGSDGIDIHSNPLKDSFEVTAGTFIGEHRQHNGSFELALVERVREPNRAVFFCAGVTGEGSRAAVEYLARNWEQLWKVHEDHCFARCLWFSKDDLHSTNPSWEPVYVEIVHS